MSEVYLGEDDEEQLKRKALDSILLAAVAEIVAQQHDPSSALQRIRESAAELIEASVSAPTAETKDYARSFTKNIATDFLNQIKLAG